MKSLVMFFAGVIPVLPIKQCTLGENEMLTPFRLPRELSSDDKEALLTEAIREQNWSLADYMTDKYEIEVKNLDPEDVNSYIKYLRDRNRASFGIV